MPELFQEFEEKPPRKKKGGYHAKDGKFTDAQTALNHHYEKEIKRLTALSNYYKCQCERLSNEVKEVVQRNKELNSIINGETNIQRKELSIA